MTAAGDKTHQTVSIIRTSTSSWNRTKMDSHKPVSLDEIPLTVLALEDPLTFQAMLPKRNETIACAPRSQPKPPSSKDKLALVANPHPPVKVIMPNHMGGGSIMSTGVPLGKAPKPKKSCTGRKKDTVKTMAPTRMSGSASHIQVISDDSEDSSGLLEGLDEDELASLVIQSVLQIETEFSPRAFEALISAPDETLSSEQKPSRAAPRSEQVLAPIDLSSRQNPLRTLGKAETLASLHEPLSSQQDPSRAAPRAGALAELQHGPPPTRPQPSCVAAKLDVPVLPEPCQTPNNQKQSSTVPDVDAPAPSEVSHRLNRQQPPFRSRKTPFSRIGKNGNQRYKLLRKLQKDFLVLARQQTKLMQTVTKVLLEEDQPGRSARPGPGSQNEDPMF